MRIHRALSTFLLAALLTSSFILSGCDSTEDEEEVAGSYEAFVFTAEIGGETVDVLDAGGDLSMTLQEDGTASGELRIPAALNEEGEGNTLTLFSATYAVSGSTVTFESEADTFIRDAEWTFAEGELRTEAFGITVVLERE